MYDAGDGVSDCFMEVVYHKDTKTNIGDDWVSAVPAGTDTPDASRIEHGRVG